MNCKHCGQPIERSADINSSADHWVHAEGKQTGYHRCDTSDSGLAYGYDAAPEDWPCSHACLGSVVEAWSA